MKEFFDRDCFDEGDEGDNIDDISEGQIGIDLVVIEINRKILEMATDLSKKCLFWRFKSLDAKLKIIEAAYKKLSSLIMITEE